MSAVLTMHYLSSGVDRTAVWGQGGRQGRQGLGNAPRTHPRAVDPRASPQDPDPLHRRHQ